MNVKSKFRRMFVAKIVFGASIFLTIFLCCLRYIILNPVNFKDPWFIASSVFLFFLILTSSDVFKIHSISVGENGIRKTILITQTHTDFLFSDLVSIDREKIRQQTSRGFITDGYHFSILTFKNNKGLIISPDDFENYSELMFSITRNFQKTKHVA